MEPTESSETSAFENWTPGRYPKEANLHSRHGESLRTNIVVLFTIHFIRMMESFPRGVLIRLGRCSEPGNEESFNISLGKILRFSGSKIFRAILLINMNLRQGRDAV